MKNFKYILTHTSGNLTVDYSPIDWRNFNMMWSRSERYHSILRSQIIDVEFPRDGKSYIDNIYNTYGIDAEVGCEIQYFKKSTRAYVTLFEGVIDLSEWVSRRDTTSVKIADSSTMAKFASRDETSIPINRTTDLDENAISSYTYLNTMTVEGVVIEELARWEDDTNLINFSQVDTADAIETIGVSDDGFSINDIGTDAELPNEGGTNTIYPYTNNTAVTVSVRYRIVTQITGTVITASAGGNWLYAIKIFAGRLSDAPLVDSATDSGNTNKTDNISLIYNSGIIETTLIAGDKL